MEGAALYSISAGVSAMAGSPASSILFDAIVNYWQKRKLRHRLRGLCITKGITTLTQKLSGPTCVYIDCDKLYDNLVAPTDAETMAKATAEKSALDDLLAFSIIKKHILNICAVWKHKVVLVSRRLALLKAMPVKHENIYFCAFSKEAEKSLGVIYSSTEEHNEAQLNKFRNIQELPEEQVFIVDSLKEAYEQVAKKFDSKVQQL